MSSESIKSEYEKYQIAPIEIMNYLEIQKDAKFSLRTLLLLSTFAIALFGFGINSELASFCISKEDSFAFSIFMFLVILLQIKITYINYKLYEPHIDNFITQLKNDIARIENVLNGIPNRGELSEEQKISHRKFMKTKLSNFEKTLKYSDIFYKKMNGS